MCVFDICYFSHEGLELTDPQQGSLFLFFKMVSIAIKAGNPKPKGLRMLKLVYPTCLKTSVHVPVPNG